MGERNKYKKFSRNLQREVATDNDMQREHSITTDFKESIKRDFKGTELWLIWNDCEQGLESVTCERANVTSGSIKGRSFLNFQTDCQHSKENSTRCYYLLALDYSLGLSTALKHFLFSLRWLWRSLSSGMWRHMVWWWRNECAGDGSCYRQCHVPCSMAP